MCTCIIQCKSSVVVNSLYHMHMHTPNSHIYPHAWHPHKHTHVHVYASVVDTKQLVMSKY